MEPPESTGIVSGLFGVVALVLANAFFVAAEFALVGARKTPLEELSRTGDRKAILAYRAVQSPERYISATQLGITLSSLGLGWVGATALAPLIEGLFTNLPGAIQPVVVHTLAFLVAFASISVLHIVLGELIPKAVALLHPEQVSRWAAGPLMGFAWLMAIPIRALNGSANGLLRLLGVRRPSEHARVHSADEIRMLIEQSEVGGEVSREDARLIEGVFEFTEKTAQDVMTPRTEIVALEASLTVDQAAGIVATAGRSRYPVHHDSLDEIVGITHAKDILKALRENPSQPIESISRPPHLVPGTREVEDVLADMKRLKVHMAIVLDEFGGTAGLITMEDLLEEIVGPIFDEHDVVEQPLDTADAPLIDGAMPIDEFNEAYQADLDDNDYTTLGGLLFGELGRLPVPGDRISVGGLTFEVIAMEGRRIKAVRLGSRADGRAEKPS